MEYETIRAGRFRERPNRFIALVEIDGEVETCHVKNTGRCRELLLPDTEVYLAESRNPARKTRYDLVAVKKMLGQGRELLINMDSQAPNQAVKEWLEQEKEKLFRHITFLKPEYRYGDSRIDFYLETEGGRRKILIEVKGVTLEENGEARFPDAPTERGIKHLLELERAVGEGYEAYVLFVIQMKPVRCFTPNDRTHPAFGDTLRQVKQNGVGILAYDCLVTPESMALDAPVEVLL